MHVNTILFFPPSAHSCRLIHRSIPCVIAGVIGPHANSFAWVISEAIKSIGPPILLFPLLRHTHVYNHPLHLHCHRVRSVAVQSIVQNTALTHWIAAVATLLRNDTVIKSTAPDASAHHWNAVHKKHKKIPRPGQGTETISGPRGAWPRAPLRHRYWTPLIACPLILHRPHNPRAWSPSSTDVQSRRCFLFYPCRIACQCENRQPPACTRRPYCQSIDLFRILHTDRCLDSHRP